MKIYDARYERTFKLAEEESEKFGLSAVVDESESALEVLEKLKGIVKTSFGGKSESASVEKTTVAPLAKATTQKAETTKTPPPAAAPTPAAKEEKVLAPLKEEKVKAPKEEKAKTPKASAITKYTRENDDHRGKLGEFIDGLLPNWRDIPPAKAAAKAASTEMEGKDFIDEKGNFVESFLEEIRQRMAPFMPESKDDL